MDPDPRLASTARRFSRGTPWESVAEVALGFDAHHPQGMVRVDDVWWVSTVDTDAGRGWVLAVDDRGRLLDRTPVGDDVCFHPGGMDFDGEALWVASSEYRPRSTAVVERLVPGSYPEPAFNVDDHVGAIVHLGRDGDLVGWTWGSRRFRRWTTEGEPVAERRDPGHFVDHQDGQWLGDDLVLCGGVATLSTARGPASIGGLALLAGDDLSIVIEAPFPHHSSRTGRAATQNPIFAEVVGDAMVVHLLPDDGAGTILSYATPLTT